MRLALPLIALALLPACRTVQTVALAPSLDAAVAAANGREVAFTFADGTHVRPAFFTVRDSTLVYSLAGSEVRYERPVREIAQLAFEVSPRAQSLAAYGLAAGGFGAAASGLILYSPAYSWSNGRTLGVTAAGVGTGLLLNYLANPRREQVLYRAVRPLAP